jgi:hypothetical protein
MLKALRPLLFLLLALPLLANDGPRLIMKMRDGSRVELQQAPARGYIVEFREPPLVARGARAATASYGETFARFRRDLGDARAGGPAANVERRITREFYRLFHGVAVMLDESEIASVRALPYVKAVHVDEPVQAFEDTTRIARIGADRVWAERKTRGAGIVVAVIDSGIDATHPALAGKVIGGYDFVDHDDDPSDAAGHGTHVAGIIAGEGAGVQGVAPDVKLLSYRVLDADGTGSSSAILTAMEWAADPDRDNDFSDHVDVANLSFGSRAGSADSPTSIAADRLVEAGVVVCISAGNTSGRHTIGSPAASRLAITVGASDAADRITWYSSRGPAFPGLTLKPEISAPGDDVVSARMGGGVVSKSGTSMAAPHVAGAAALLLALHPEWSPAEVKAALVTSADPVEEEVMGQGGGRLNVYNATGSAIAVSPAVISFGNGNAGAWTRSRTVQVTNRGPAARTFTATTTAQNGVTITAEPPTFTLDPGASRDVVLTAAIGAGAPPSPLSLSYGGGVSFRTDDATARVPWVAIGAAEVRVGYDAPFSDTGMVWRCSDGVSAGSRYEGDLHWAMLLPYSRCGMTLYSLVRQGPREGEVTLLLETHDVTGDMQLQRSPADSIHAIELAGVDAGGALIRPTERFETPYTAPYFFHLPPDSLFDLDTVMTFSYLPLRVNTIPDGTLTAAQVLFDFPRHRVIAVNHEPVQGGIHSDVTLRSLPSDLRHVRVNVTPQTERMRLQPSVATFSREPGYGSVGGGYRSLLDGWRGDVYVTPAANPEAWAAPAFGTGSTYAVDFEMDLLSEGIRWIDGRFVLTYQHAPAPGAYSVGPGETLRLGERPLHVRTNVTATDTGFSIFPQFFGPAGELMQVASNNFAYELRDASGTLLREGTGAAAMPVFGTAAPRGAYRATIRHADTELALSFDTALQGFNPPLLTAFRVLGADAVLKDAVAPGEAATLAFSAHDTRAVRAWWRTGGEWQPLAVTLSDALYRGELPTNVFGPVDLRVELEDASGNTATTTMNDAYSVGARRRAARR